MGVMEEEVGVHLRGCFFMELGFFFKKLGDKLGGKIDFSLLFLGGKIDFSLLFFFNTCVPHVRLCYYVYRILGL